MSLVFALFVENLRNQHKSTDYCELLKHRACADIGKQLDEDGVLDAAVENGRALNALADRFNAAVHLRDHAALDDAVAHELGHFRNLESMQHAVFIVNGLRYTDRETMDIVQMVLCGKVNKDLVTLLEKAGGRGIGLGGMDGGLFQAKRLTDRSGTDYGYVGDIVDVDPAPVIDVLQQGYIPVVSTVAQGIDDETNYNINADTAASKLAVALGAKKLILLTDVRGLMLDVNDPDSVIHRLKVSEVPKLVRDGVIKGGMIPKVDCCVEAVRKGVERATILDGRVKHSILIELLSKVGAGTMFQ